MKQYNKVCKQCGNKFITNKGKTVYCGDECRHKAKLMYKHKKVAKERETKTREERIKHHKDTQSELIRLAVEARKHGMTYGEYMTYLYWEAERAKRK